jgi:hypothetical protein
MCIPQILEKARSDVKKFKAHYLRAKLVVKKTYESLPEVMQKSKKILK